jgi:hypothetical protein
VEATPRRMTDDIKGYSKLTVRVRAGDSAGRSDK